MGVVTDTNSLTKYLELSAILTGFTVEELQGTGMALVYLDTLRDTVGDDLTGAMLLKFSEAKRAASSCAECSQALIEEVLEDKEVGPLARNVLLMWYLGTWFQLPRGWRNQYGAAAIDYERIISAEAYKQSLVFRAVGTHPFGARQPGYATWSQEPHDPTEGQLEDREGGRSEPDERPPHVRQHTHALYLG